MENIDKSQLKINKNNCPIREVLDILGGKWAFSIVYSLLDGKKRFKELERSIEGINTRMLVKELKSMEENKILIREAFATIPPTVEYSLTEKGKKLEPILAELYKWGKEFVH
ncbi:MAG: helix-turn-helix domain-containing protein [Bacteroidetes bacterium]|nr:helix-turn-helix domain-containing protein [Bacteroidota bacterium]